MNDRVILYIIYYIKIRIYISDRRKGRERVYICYFYI